MRALTNPASKLASVIDTSCVIILIVILLVTTYQVFARYVLNSPTFWSAEAARYLMVWLTMLGSASLLKDNNGHISVEYFVDRLPIKIGLIMMYVRDFLTILMCALLAYYGMALVGYGTTKTSSGLGIPMSYPYLAIPVGAILIALVLCLTKAEQVFAKCKNTTLVANNLRRGTEHES